MARVVVTGGAGFLGSHLVDALRARGDTVVVVDNLATGSLLNLAQHGITDSTPEGLRGDGVDLLLRDVCDGVFLTGPVDSVLHLASPASPRAYLDLPIQTLKAGGLGTHNALGLARAKGARFLLASTSEVYGDPLVHPQPESYWGNVNPVGPRGVYDEAKRFAEALTMAYRQVHGLETQIVRIFNTYGPRMRFDDGRVLPSFLDAAMSGRPLSVHGTGEHTRSFCYVSDTVAGILTLLEKGDGHPVNVGAQGEMTILEFAHLMKELTGSDSPIQHVEAMVEDPQRREPELTRAAAIGWRPQVTLREGVARTIAWYEASTQAGAAE